MDFSNFNFNNNQHPRRRIFTFLRDLSSPWPEPRRRGLDLERLPSFRVCIDKFPMRRRGQRKESGNWESDFLSFRDSTRRRRRKRRRQTSCGPRPPTTTLRRDKEWNSDETRLGSGSRAEVSNSATWKIGKSWGSKRDYLCTFLLHIELSTFSYSNSNPIPKTSHEEEKARWWECRWRQAQDEIQYLSLCWQWYSISSPGHNLPRPPT